MKKILFLFLALSIMQVSGQNLKSLTGGETSSSTSMIEGLAADQVKSLTKKLNLSENQQDQVSGLVVSQLKSEKFQKMIGGLNADKLTESSDKGTQTEQIGKALMEGKDFQKGMSSILDDKQKETMRSFMPKY